MVSIIAHLQKVKKMKRYGHKASLIENKVARYEKQEIMVLSAVSLLSADNLLFAILANIATIIEYKMKERKF